MPIQESIIDLTRRLVRIPSRAGIDSYERVFELLGHWLEERGVPVRIHTGARGGSVALVAEVAGEPGPHYVLNATVDTAGFGDESAWSAGPTSGEIRDGWMYGRGSADSKAGVAIFCHVATAWRERRVRLGGTLKLVFDGDEHTGEFGGIRRALECEGRESIAGVLLGYPGIDRVGVGGRGFERAEVRVHGTAAHSGSGSARGVNAIHAAARLVTRLEAATLDGAGADAFPLPPRVSVTMMQGGDGFSEVPDICRLHVDIRLTPSFGRAEARSLLTRITGELDRESDGDVPGTEIEWLGGWPAYRLPPDSRVANALLDAAGEVLDHPVEPAVVGPSNVGNMLFQEGIEATCGFGVAYRNVHGTDERIDLATVLPVFETYHRAVGKLLGPS